MKGVGAAYRRALRAQFSRRMLVLSSAPLVLSLLLWGALLWTGLQPLLDEFYREKLALLLRHQAGARLVPQYDVNNTYQYIINREEAHLSWVGRSISDLGATVPGSGAEPDRQASGTAERG